METHRQVPESGGGAPNVTALPRPILISSIGGIVLFISVFLDWYSASVSASGVNLSGLGSASASVSGWHATDLAKLVALLAVIAVAGWAVELFATDITLPVRAWQIAGGAGALAVLLVLYRMISKPGGAHSEAFSFQSATIHLDISNAFGIYLALLAAVATVVGAVMAMRSS